MRNMQKNIQNKKYAEFMQKNWENMQKNMQKNVQKMC